MIFYYNKNRYTFPCTHKMHKITHIISFHLLHLLFFWTIYTLKLIQLFWKIQLLMNTKICITFWKECLTIHRKIQLSKGVNIRLFSWKIVLKISYYRNGILIFDCNFIAHCYQLYVRNMNKQIFQWVFYKNTDNYSW